MTDAVEQLRQNLIRARAFVREGVFYALRPKEREFLFVRSGDLLEKLESVSQSSLLIGMIGGTGVGKSSLMNALAGSPIASTSHRRPHTDAVLIYRFRDTSLPSNFPLDRIPWKEVTHDEDSISQILICDLPDFDSIVGEHRDQVLTFLGYLDIVIWVTSPEKYADASFFTLLKDVPMARRNFYFVVNKVDLLFDEGKEGSGYERLHSISMSLRHYLRDAGVEEPVMYHVSALEFIENADHAPWNQLLSLRAELFRQRELKEVRVIKAANIDKETDDLFGLFEKEMLNLAMFKEQIGRIAEDFKREMEKWGQSFHEAITLWSESTPLRMKLISMTTDRDVLVGPSALMFHFGRGGAPPGTGEPGEVGTILSDLDDVVSLVRNQTERIAINVEGRLLREGIIAPLVERLRSEFDHHSMEQVEETIITSGMASFSEGNRHRYALYRGAQYAVYLLIACLLVFSLAGEAAWRDLYNNPGMATALNFIATAVVSAFTPRGLAALGSFALINVFIGYRFHSRYVKIVEKRANRLLRSFANGLEMIWKEQLEHLYGRLTTLGGELNENIDEIRRLKQ
ncbi:MAG: 50S ribosome-binding GTPase [Deltaproteobacteria bacterium]|nr:50S ribosome-binding GTPase [Deltaproteobacteria bacterium]